VALLTEEDLSPKERRYREQRDSRIDHILRRLHNNGIDSLNNGELDFLERSAAELRFELGMDETQPHHE
jgi:hypothetical protein